MAQNAPGAPTTATWVNKGFALLFIIFCMELGLVLLVYPWTEKWTQNYIPAHITSIREAWASGYFRGVVSGLGILNLWISLTEIFRLRRFSAHLPHE